MTSSSHGMNPARRRSYLAFVPVLTLGLVVACGGDDDGSGDSSSGSGGSSPSLSALEERLAACPDLSLTSDPSASACLVGTYEGTTPSGEACSLELGEAGAYEFTSPSLSVSHTAPDDTIFVFDHTSIGGFEQLAWKVSDPISIETWYELDFTARFGTGADEATSKIQIEVTEYGEDTTTSVVCVVDL
ncbi:hypothetical protein WME73_48305 [Sorangium sp. So ce302]|uniref:hypothetical protein n=1 Tax=unclassified Sorangium TaxID=2621164 RepID=UPI003F5F2D6B